jgi:REP element-mobilizing transposase RayT
VWRGHSCPRNLTTSTQTIPLRNCVLEKIPDGHRRILYAATMARRVILPCPAQVSADTNTAVACLTIKDDRPLFVSFRVRTPFELCSEARTLALQHCLHDNGKTIRIHAVVIMPDHAHLLFTAIRDAKGWTFALPEILRAIKGSSARSINRLSGRTGPVWQDESFDHVLRGDESLRETIEYIRQNPVREGLVERPEDYQWLWVECGART